MARPKKSDAERRDRKVVLWMNAQEQARYLTHAARAGSTGPDYARALLCRLPSSAGKKPREIRLQVSARLHGRLLAASASSEATPEELIERLLGAVPSPPSPAGSFELIDALTRIGRELTRLTDIAADTGYIPDELAELCARLDRLLDAVLPP